MSNIFISPGHYEYTWEKEHAKGIQADDGLFQEFDDFNIKVPNYLVPLLEQHKEFKIHQLEYDNNKLDKTLRERIDYINKICTMDDIIISIHGNYSDDFNIHGAWGLYSGIKSKKLIDLYIKHSKNNSILYTKTYECNTKEKWLNLGIVLKTKCPVILLEAGFFSNKNDRTILKTSKYHKEVALSLYLMTCEYYNIQPILKKDKETEDWKLKNIQWCLEYKILEDPIWLSKCNDTMPIWAICTMFKKYNDIKLNNSGK